MDNPLNRRQLIGASIGTAILGAGASAAIAQRSPSERKPEPRSIDQATPFLYGLNTSTLRGYKLPIETEVELAAAAGYGAIEPWVAELDVYAKAGHALTDLGKRLRDLGLVVPSAIGFFEWGVDDEDRRKLGLEEARRSMEAVRSVGGLRIAAPPSGLTDRDDVDLHALADRYRALLDIGDLMGVVPEVEVWGFSKTLNRLGDAMLVAIEADHPSACILPDVYHLYKGGSGLNGVRLLSGEAFHVIHMNDYPADPTRESITDAQRVYPGDGVAPLGDLIRDLRDVGFHGVLSLELFNESYWKGEPADVCRTGLEKMQAAVAEALA